MAEEKFFVKVYDFEMYRNNMYNGSVEMLIPNLPDIFDKYYVKVEVYGLKEKEDLKEPVEIPRQEDWEEPIIKGSNFSTSKEPLSARQLSSYIKNVKRSRRH